MVFSEVSLPAAAPEDVSATYCVAIRVSDSRFRASAVRRPSGPGRSLLAPQQTLSSKKAPPRSGLLVELRNDDAPLELFMFQDSKRRRVMAVELFRIQ